jgi:hypothetical protein
MHILGLIKTRSTCVYRVAVGGGDEHVVGGEGEGDVAGVEDRPQN